MHRFGAPSPALVVSAVALFVALGGTTYAAVSVPKNSVGTAQLKNNAVTAPKIKNGAVTAEKIDTTVLTGFALAGKPFVVQTLNGVGNSGNCASGTLAIEVFDGRHTPIDARFTMMVGTSPITYAQIRDTGSIRTSSSNVTSVVHTAGSGIYCVGFTTTVPNQAQLEGAVAGFGTN